MMFDDSAFDHWCLRLALPEETKKLIAHIRASPPARRVRSAAGNVSGRYPSKKMGVSIQFESHHLEFPAIHEMEHDPDVLAFYDQPGRIKLTYQGKNSDRRVGAIHTPDFFVIRQDRAGWLECKMEERLGELAEDMPHRYVRGSDGTWSCPPGEAYAEPFGLFYSLYTSAQIDWIYQRNLLFLEDYLRVNAPAIPEEQTEAICTTVMRNTGLTLRELLGKHPVEWADAIYFLIVTDGLYADLRAAPLAEPDKVRVFLNRKMAHAHAVLTPLSPSVPRPHILQAPVGTSLLWDGKPWSILNIGLTLTTLRSERNELVDLPHETFETLLQQGKVIGLDIQPREAQQERVQTRLAQASPDDLREAKRRYALLGAWQEPDSDSATSSVSTRTLERWQQHFREAEATLGNGYLGLLPRAGARGNRLKKLPESAESLMETFILNDYETLKQKPKHEVYIAFERQAKLEGLAIIPSYKTFWKRIKQRPAHQQTLKRQGKRAATPLEPWVWELERTTPKHGDRPLEIGHLDHTLLDVELVSARTGRSLGRPWASFLMDAFTRRLLAIYLTFDPPSYRSCMMLLRECVWRYGRLPQIMVVDGGREFDSTYFETLAAYYGCTKKSRPWAKPRYGSVCERLFGTANTQFVHDLLGNTQIMQRVRQVTKKIQPKEQAVWTLGDLYDYLSIWAFEVYDLAEHPALGQSPADAFRMGLAMTGERAHMRYDDDFRYLSLAGPRREKKGTAKVEQGHGVKINYVYYSSKFFALPGVEGTDVLVRYDPFDIGVAYAFVQGNWVKCLSEHYLQLRGHTEREIQLASAELRKSQQNHGRGSTVTAKRLADFLASVEAHEAVLTQRQHDLEGRSVLARLGGYRMLPGEQDQALFDDVPSAPTPVHVQDAVGVLEPAVLTQDDEEDDLEHLDEYEEYH
jgi:transposase InsO family protein